MVRVWFLTSWECGVTPSLTLLPGPLWPRAVVVPVRGPIYGSNRSVWNKVLTCLKMIEKKNKIIQEDWHVIKQWNEMKIMGWHAVKTNQPTNQNIHINSHTYSQAYSYEYRHIIHVHKVSSETLSVLLAER